MPEFFKTQPEEASSLLEAAVDSFSALTASSSGTSAVVQMLSLLSIARLCVVSRVTLKN